MAKNDTKGQDDEWLKNWRMWAGWASWGSPVGLGIFLVSLGAMLWLFHLAGLL